MRFRCGKCLLPLDECQHTSGDTIIGDPAPQKMSAGEAMTDRPSGAREWLKKNRNKFSSWPKLLEAYAQQQVAAKDARIAELEKLAARHCLDAMTFHREWKAAEKERHRLQVALVLAAIPLEALLLSVTLELSPEIKRAVKDSADEIRAALNPAQSGEPNA